MIDNTLSGSTALRAYAGPDKEEIQRSNCEMRGMVEWLERHRTQLFEDEKAKGHNYIAIISFPPQMIHPFRSKGDLLAFRQEHPFSAYIYRNRDKEIYML